FFRDKVLLQIRETECYLIAKGGLNFMIGVEHLLPLLGGFLNRVKGQKFSFHLLLQMVKEVVEAVEKVYLSATGKSSNEKKRIALEAVEYLYKQIGIDIPKLPTWIEVWLIRTITSVVIDWLVSVYNEKKIFSHNHSVPRQEE
ncbi:MAG: hypothetical protein QME64_05365, partial [bacterium]|nr:hypothetical protein [bacterium]